MNHLKKILVLNAVGIALFLSWYLPGNSGFWFELDKGVFFFFNHLLGQSQAFLYFVAFTNLRPFDVVAFLFMLGIFYSYYRKQDIKGKCWMLAMGVTMLVTAVIAKQFDLFLNMERPSASKFFTLMGDSVLRVSELSGWPAKDWSSSSFPGDHGMFLLIFSFFMFRYFGWRAFAKSAAVVLVFSLPRIMSGAHWVTDIAVGAASVNFIVLSWMLMTPASDYVIRVILNHWPKKLLKDDVSINC